MFVLKCLIFLKVIVFVMSSNVNVGHKHFQNDNFFYPVDFSFKNKVLNVSGTYNY